VTPPHAGDRHDGQLAPVDWLAEDGLDAGLPADSLGEPLEEPGRHLALDGLARRVSGH
jgi:hypothetical protein